MVDEAHTSLAALIIAVVAMFIASVQLLQQLFGTADGYRRCQESIIGPWSGLTRLSWRWSEFRFETKYTTPLIVSYDTDERVNDPRIVGINDKSPPLELQQTIHNCDHEVCNRPIARWRQTLNAVRGRRRGRRQFSTSPGDQVSWTLFLRMIHDRQTRWQIDGSLVTEKQALEGPLMPSFTVERDFGVVYVERSWDLMIPEVTRPLATSTLGDIVVVAHRMGMRWLDLRFSEGFLRAEGNGHSLSATLLRGLGPVFQYSFEKKAHVIQMHEINGGEPAFEWIPGKDALVPTKETDMMACGILVGDPMLGLSNLHLAGSDDAETHHMLRLALVRFGVAKEVATRLSDGYTQRGIVNGWQSRSSFALGDLVGLVSPFIPLPGSDINLIVNPIRTSQVGSSFLFWESREIFLLRLKDIAQQRNSADITHGRSNLAMICDYLTELHDQYPDDFFDRWEKDPFVKQSTGRADATSSHINTGKQRYLQRLYEMHTRTTEYFSERPEHFKHLVAEYINIVADAWPRAIENTRQGKARDTKGKFDGPRNQWHENGHVILDSVEELIRRMEGRFGGRDGAIDAWWMLVLRGMTWYMSVWITVPTSLVPSYCYASQSVVYLS